MAGGKMAGVENVSELCSVCDREIKENTASIACALCLSWCHKGCTGLSRSEFNKHSSDWKRNHKHSWACEDCKVRKSAVGAPRRSINSNHRTNATSSSSSPHQTPATNTKHRTKSIAPTTKTMPTVAKWNSDDVTDKLTCNIPTILAKNQDQLTLKDAISAISQLYQVIVEQGNTMVSLLNEIITLKNNSDESRVSALEQETQNLREELASIKKATSKENAISTDHGNVDVINDSLRELNDRQQRQRNLMIFGIRESTPTHDQSKSQLDTLIVNDIIRIVHPDVSLDDIKVIRVGREDPDKHRPLKVIMKSAVDVTAIVRQAKEIKKVEDYRLISLSFDRTPKQVEEYRALRATLSTRLQNGERDLRIKYLNGCPRIIKTRISDLN